MLRGRPTPFEGALVEPKQRILDFIAIRKDRTLTATYIVSYFSSRTVIKVHIVDLRMLRFCKDRRHFGR